MEKFLTSEECESILSNVSGWEFYNDDFIYYQKIIQSSWLNDKMKKILHEHKNILSNEIISSRIIKLPENYKLPTHTFNYFNQNSLFKDTTFSIVVFLNENFLGGSYYHNNSYMKLFSGGGVIHDRTTSQRLDRIEKGICYLLFCHFGQILTNKIL